MKIKSVYKLIPYHIILNAINQDPYSIKIVVRHYRSYIIKLCFTNFERDIQLITPVDDFLIRHIETKLMEAILKFKIN
ncbi:hypothetical protein IGI96_003511 [Enterococcus sp. DIV0421]|uniref:helix-turn-helix domain-containing protein n=1 Tax=Enterococcus sp. DIV0421 TaxID=2774688 RepID=UPI003F21ED9A